MAKRTNISRNSTNGRFVTTRIGSSKAEKFSSVEGLSLSKKSARTLTSLKSKGYSGDALRNEIKKNFK